MEIKLTVTVKLTMDNWKQNKPVKF